MMTYNLTETASSATTASYLEDPFDHGVHTHFFDTTNWGAGGDIPGLFLQVMYSIIAVAGIIGNFLVVFSVARVPSVRNLTSLFLVSLAVADFITAAVLIPLHLGIEISIPDGGAGNALCRLLLSKFPLWTSFTASVLSLTCVTVERYFGIVYPLRYDTIFTIKRALYMVVAAWTMAVVLNSYMLYIFFAEDGGCIIRWPSYGLQVLVGVGNFFIIYAVPLTAMFLCYARMMKALSLSEIDSTEMAGRSARASVELHQARKRLVKMLVIICVTFAICWAPNQFIFLAYNLGWKDMNFESWYYHSTVLIASFNSCVNPIIYVFRNRQYRRALVIAVCGQKAFNAAVDCGPVMVAPSIAATADMMAVNRDFQWASMARDGPRNLESPSTRIELEPTSTDSTVNASQIAPQITVIKETCQYSSYIEIT